MEAKVQLLCHINASLLIGDITRRPRAADTQRDALRQRARTIDGGGGPQPPGEIISNRHAAACTLAIQRARTLGTSVEGLVVEEGFGVVQPHPSCPKPVADAGEIVPARWWTPQSGKVGAGEVASCGDMMPSPAGLGGYAGTAVLTSARPTASYLYVAACHSEPSQ